MTQLSEVTPLLVQLLSWDGDALLRLNFMRVSATADTAVFVASKNLSENLIGGMAQKISREPSLFAKLVERDDGPPVAVSIVE